MCEEYFDLLPKGLSLGINLIGRALEIEVSDELMFIAMDRTRFRVGAALCL